MFGACPKEVDKHPGVVGKPLLGGPQPGPGLIDVNSSGVPWVGDLELMLQNSHFPPSYVAGDGWKLGHGIYLGEAMDLCLVRCCHSAPSLWRSKKSMESGDTLGGIVEDVP